MVAMLFETILTTRAVVINTEGQIAASPSPCLPPIQSLSLGAPASIGRIKHWPPNLTTMNLRRQMRALPLLHFSCCSVGFVCGSALWSPPLAGSRPAAREGGGVTRCKLRTSVAQGTALGSGGRCWRAKLRRLQCCRSIFHSVLASRSPPNLSLNSSAKASV